jgi:transposase
MAKPLSDDLRKRLVEAVEGGQSRQAAAKRYAVSPSAVVKLMQKWFGSGTFKPDRQGKPPEFKLAKHEDAVRKLVAERSDATLMELKAQLAKAGIKVSKSALDRFLKHLGLGYKKNRAGQRARQA